MTARRARVLERADVTAENWLDAPYDRLGLVRVRELALPAPISRGEGYASEPPRGELPLDSSHFGFEGYAGVMRPPDTHLLASVSRSTHLELTSEAAWDAPAPSASCVGSALSTSESLGT